MRRYQWSFWRIARTSTLFLAFFAARAEATVTQIDGTIVPKNNTLCSLLDSREGSASYCDGGDNGQPEASLDPQFFTILDNDPSTPEIPIPFTLLAEASNGDFTFGFYLVADPDCRVEVFTCGDRPIRTVTLDFSQSIPYEPNSRCLDPDSDGAGGIDQPGSYEAVVDGPIGFFLASPDSTSDGCGDLQDRTPPPDDLFFTQRALNTDGDFIHALIYTSETVSNRFYFAFESGLSSGDNKFTDTVVQVEGLEPPCVPSPEICGNGVDDDCDGIIDDDFAQAGEPCGFTDGECQPGILACLDGIEVCVGEIGPQPETCDNLDNDCDGFIDNNLTDAGQLCGSDVGECTTGTTFCQAGQLVCSGIGPAPEVCDNLDNDCDGIPDNDPVDTGPAFPCGSDVGECSSGFLECLAGERICNGVGPAPEVCDNLDNDCDNQIDEASDVLANDPAVGQLCGSDVGECNPGVSSCQAGVIICQNNTGPQQEICDGLDNDCDGLVDELEDLIDIGDPCGSSVGECSQGLTTCAPDPLDSNNDGLFGIILCQGDIGPAEELCDGLDNDCDGIVDNNPQGVGQSCGEDEGACETGLTACQGGSLVCIGNVGPSEELCDGIDNDCDGEIDESAQVSAEDLRVGQSCGSNVGECSAGRTICQAGAVVCVGDIKPQPELCDNLDNDCDGQTDEIEDLAANDSRVGQVCGSNVGECSTGLTFCSAGTIACSATGPTTEVCDNLDNDCDGVVDNNLLDERIGVSCGTDTGSCQAGITICQDGAPSCFGEVGPGVELCNGLDDDCDGVADNNPVDVNTSCGVSDVGECSLGTLQCLDGVKTCVGAIGPVLEVCNGLDDDCDGEIDDDPIDAGALCGTDTGICVAGTQECINGSLQCIGAIGPEPQETCNGLDDDCNGLVDDNPIENNQSCGSDVGECSPGFTNCQGGVVVCLNAQGPQPEICDGLDNDCDGEVDEASDLTDVGFSCGSDLGECSAGITVCENAQIVCEGAIGPQPELCNSLDDDCDGLIDNNPVGQGEACGSDVGVCELGAQTCIAGQLLCLGGVGPADEICDGLDNDCDGEIDNNPADVGGLCGTEEGECSPGTLVCISDPDDSDGDGTLAEVVCQGEIGPTDEVCDGLDNDCDGAIDDNTIDSGGSCTSSGDQSCGGGILLCIDGQLSCQGEIVPAPEVCNCLDDDCDGQADEAPLDIACPEGTQCVDCACRQPCDIKLSCPGGLECIDGFCRVDLCAGVVCGEEERCQDGQCIPECEGIVCEPGNVCQDGACVPDDCYHLGCPDGQICLEGQCQANPCDQVQCDASRQEFCDPTDGQCHRSCSGVLCPLGERCSDGECVPDLCDPPPSCQSGEVCDPSSGNCIDDPCRGVRCGPGQICEVTSGECVDDPCAHITCPGDPETTFCSQGECFSTQTTLVLTSGGCSVASPDDVNHGSFWLLVALSGLVLLLRRRIWSVLALLCLLALQGCILDPVGLDETGNINPNPNGCIPTNGGIEICDGIDNDCDGTVDADFCSICIPTNGGDEICDGRDNDCDNQIDEDFDLQSDPQNCGQCGNNCNNLFPGGFGKCTDGVCEFDRCAAGFFDLDPLEPGCEYACQLTGDEICDGRDNDCDGEVDEGFDLQNDLQNCGACGDVCALSNASETCQNGQCILLQCDPNFEDRDQNPENGCEAFCSQTNGGVEICDNLDNDCDGQTDEGFDLQGDPQNCGACGRVCTFPNAAEICQNGQCALGACEPGFVNLDGVAANGCEYACSQTNGGVEICDGLDNDCDGEVDEDLTETGGQCATLPTTGQGECGFGTLVCTAGVLQCVGEGLPRQETCDGLDNDCNGAIDDDPVDDERACGSNIGECRLGQTACVGGTLVCTGDTGPAEEVCDGRDNDCDGQIDNNLTDALLGQSCGLDVGECTSGTFQCVSGNLACLGGTDPATEVCDGLDNNCDGEIDNDPVDVGSPCGSDVGACQTGVLVCQPGGVIACEGEISPADEVCNGIDDDCDGVTDEAPSDAGGPCGSSDVGECQLGVLRCSDGSLVCDGAIEPRAELCDGKDNDCDGQIDNNPQGVGQSCGSDIGECTPGTTACSGGQIVCEGSSGPVDESCDGLDNDCDGAIDDNPSDAGGACGSSDVGECQLGALLCVNGGIACVGAVEPSPEVCDGLDNDCNGIVDDNIALVGQACGGGLGECSPGALVCQNGQLLCEGAAEPSPEICDGLDNDCDGFIDEGATGGNIGQSCGDTDLGECSFGIVVCQAGQEVCSGAVGPTNEICDGKDNDCDGQIDNNLADPRLDKVCGTNVGECISGLTGCVADPSDANGNGKLAEIECIGAVGPTQESCNGLDEDCDGVIDNNLSPSVDPDLEQVCGSSDLGECQFGVNLCVGGAIECVGAIEPRAERCNGLDDDCNGQIDDNLTDPGLGQSCGTDAGVCSAGVQECVSGVLQCVGATGPDPEGEICDNLDNDCDGLIDGFDPTLAPPPPGTCPPALGVCAGVTSICRDGAFVCNVPSTFEEIEGSCDGLDNDCDGEVDEDCLFAQNESSPPPDSTPGTHSFNPSVAVDGSNVFVAYTDNSSGTDVFFRRSTNRGASFTSGALTISNSNKRAARPNVIVPQSGVVAVFYEEFPASNSDSRDVMLARSANSGVSFFSPVRIDLAGSVTALGDTSPGSNGGNAGDVFFLDAATDGNGRLYVVWADTRHGPQSRNVYFRASINGGASFGPEIKINQIGASNAAFASDPKVAIGQNGRAIVVYTDASITGEPDLFAVTIDNPHSSSPDRSLPTRLDQGPIGGVLQNPVVAADSAGNVVVAWEDLRDPNGIDLFYLSNNANGAPSAWTLETLLDAPGLLNDAVDIQIAVGPPSAGSSFDTFYLSWEDHRAGLPEQLVARSTDGGAFFSDQCRIGSQDTLCKVSRVSVVGGSIFAGVTSQPRLAVNENGVVFASFVNNRFGKKDIFANFSLDGGQTWQTTDLRLDTASPAGSADSLNPDLAAGLGAGHDFAITVWEDRRQNGVLSNIFANRVEN